MIAHYTIPRSKEQQIRSYVLIAILGKEMRRLKDYVTASFPVLCKNGAWGDAASGRKVIKEEALHVSSVSLPNITIRSTRNCVRNFMVIQ